MRIALWLLAFHGLVGAFDTVYYHEWLARLPLRGRAAGTELKLHAARDFLYTVLFGTLPFLAWQGLWLVLLAATIVAEIVLTLTDFVVEATERKPIGDVYPGERVTHAVLGIMYGAMIACLIPDLMRWWTLPTALAWAPPPISDALRWGLFATGIVAALSGLRDIYAAYGLPYGSWPWRPVDIISN